MNINGATGSVFTLTNVRLTDEGSYSVAASNCFGAVSSEGVFLTVHDFALRPALANGEEFCLSWQLAPGRTNLVQSTDALDQPFWRTVEAGFTTNGLTVLFKEAMHTNLQRFYRILVTP